jgi:PTS system fructose-specific IIC component/PTS system nitrogen regulatory IIA component
MAVVELMAEEIVKTPLTSQDKPDVLRELVQILMDAGHIDNFDSVLDAVQEREDQMSTGLEGGIAVPHAKSASVDSLKIAIGIAPDGIDFNALDGNPTKLFFLLVAPPDKAGPHVQALAEIAKLSQSKAFCRALINAENAAEVVALMRGD